MSHLTWIAHYEDDSYLAEKDGAVYDRIDRARLSDFILYHFERQVCAYTLILEPGQRLIYRKRTQMYTGATQGSAVWHLVGWQQTIEGSNVQSIAWVRDDLLEPQDENNVGQALVEHRGRFSDGLFAPVVFRPQEGGEG